MVDESSVQRDESGEHGEDVVDCSSGCSSEVEAGVSGSEVFTEEEE